MSDHKNIPQQPLSPEELLDWAENRLPKSEKEQYDDPFAEEAAEGVRLMENPEELLQKTSLLNKKIQGIAGAAPAANPSIVQLFTTPKFMAVAASIAVVLVASFLFLNVIQEANKEMANAPSKTEQSPVADQLQKANELETKDAEESNSIITDELTDKNTGEVTEKTIANKDQTRANGSAHQQSIVIDEKPETNTPVIVMADEEANKKEAEEASSAAESDFGYGADDDVETEDAALTPIAKEKAAPKKLEKLADAEEVDDDILEEVSISNHTKSTKKKNKLKANKKAGESRSSYKRENTSRKKDDQLLPKQFLGDTTINLSSPNGSIFKVENYTSLKLDAQQNKALNKGISYFNLQEYDKAHRQYNLVLKDLPNSQEVNFQQGLAYLQQDKLKKAQRSFEKVRLAQLDATYKDFDLDALINFLKAKDAAGARKLLQEKK